MENKNIIWSPQPKQAEFMMRGEDEVLYGGAAGGGKSDALLMEALRQVSVPNYKAIIFRRTFPQTRELVDRSSQLYPKIYPEAKYNASLHYWQFPSGAKIHFGAMQHDRDRFNYHGQAFDFVAFDELTTFSHVQYSYMITRNRPSGPGTRCYIRSTTNPGGIGHGWVKQRFIENKEPYKTYWETIDVDGKKYKRSTAFVPATVFDNNKLLENNPNYVANLASMPDELRRAYLLGDWDVFSGQVFTEYRNSPKHYIDRKYTHVIEPFKIPDTWKRYRSFDFGYTKPFSVGWWAMDFDGRLYRYRELYGCEGTPDVGVEWEPRKIARAIRQIEDKYEKGHTIYGVADSAIWDTSVGSDASIIRQMEEEGVYFEKSKKDRLSGKMQLHYRLAFDKNGLPMLYVFKTCKAFIRTVPSLVYSDVKVEDVDTKQEDHVYDEVRYLLMENPIPPKRNYEMTKTEEFNFEESFDPLNLGRHKKG